MAICSWREIPLQELSIGPDLGLVTSLTVRKHISVVEATQSVVLEPQQNRRVTQKKNLGLVISERVRS